MKRSACLFAAALVSCGSNPAPISSATADPAVAADTAPTSEVGTSEPAATAAPSAGATAAANSKSEDGKTWSIDSGSGNGLSFKNDIGQALTVSKLEWAGFLRKTVDLGRPELPGANVSFAKLTADGATASDSLCRLPAWDSPPTDPLTIATAMVTLLIVDAMPIIPVLQSKAALLACNHGQKVRVRFAVEQSQWTDVGATGVDASTSACVKAVLRKTVAAGSGACVTTIEP